MKNKNIHIIGTVLPVKAAKVIQKEPLSIRSAYYEALRKRTFTLAPNNIRYISKVSFSDNSSGQLYEIEKLGKIFFILSKQEEEISLPRPSIHLSAGLAILEVPKETSEKLAQRRREEGLKHYQNLPPYETNHCL